MEFIRRRIERQIFGLTGLALNEIDYERPQGDPGLFGPGSLCWRIHADFPSMLCGGISALMLQMMHPLALAGVWDHSNFREDMLGRLRRTSQFIAATTFASTADARRLNERVRAIHAKVTGIAPDGRAYSADDPELLTWIHVAEVKSFLAAYMRYRDPLLSEADQDRYLDEIARVAEDLGAEGIPRTRRQVDAYIERMRPSLVYDERTAEVLGLVLSAPAPGAMADLARSLMSKAAVDLLPDWARSMAGVEQSAIQRAMVRSGMQTLARVLRWSIRNGASNRALRRVQGIGSV
ncbi:oxygenase MpaB family protein [Acidihalobacter prosperus]